MDQDLGSRTDHVSDLAGVAYGVDSIPADWEEQMGQCHDKPNLVGRLRQATVGTQPLLELPVTCGDVGRKGPAEASSF